MIVNRLSNPKTVVVQPRKAKIILRGTKSNLRVYIHKQIILSLKSVVVQPRQRQAKIILRGLKVTYEYNISISKY
jgi:hypothetical protein